LAQAVSVESLPAVITRSLGSIFANRNPRTLARDEAKGLLPRLKGASRTACYRKQDFLRYLGLLPEENPAASTPGKPARRRRATASK
jgi:hypothetical protein